MNTRQEQEILRNVIRINSILSGDISDSTKLELNAILSLFVLASNMKDDGAVSRILRIAINRLLKIRKNKNDSK